MQECSRIHIQVKVSCSQSARPDIRFKSIIVLLRCTDFIHLWYNNLIWVQPCYKMSDSFEVEMRLFVDLYVSATRKKLILLVSRRGCCGGYRRGIISRGLWRVFIGVWQTINFSYQFTLVVHKWPHIEQL